MTNSYLGRRTAFFWGGATLVSFGVALLFPIHLDSRESR